MGYNGQTYQIPCDRGGLTANPNIDQIKPEMMVSARNINIHENGRETRGGTSHVNSTAISGTPRIMGIKDFTLINSNQFIVTAGGDGTIWSNYTTQLKTGLGSNRQTMMTIYKNKLYMTNGNDVPQVWDGAAGSTSDLALVPSDWTGTAQPKQFIKHSTGNSERLWAYLNNTVYASAAGAADFSNGNVLTWNIETGDGSGIVGGMEFGSTLFFFSKLFTFQMVDTDPNTNNWYYNKSQFEGGAAHARLIALLPNDIVCMKEDGNIYSVTAVQSFGDYKQASITRPSWIDKWIRDNVNLTYINDFHMVWDPVLRAIKVFVVRNGQTTIDTCLVYFIDRGPDEGWVIHDNQNYASGYSASCAGLVRVGAGNYRIYTGDYSGFVWSLEGTSYNDNSNGYYAGFKTARLTFDNPRTNKQYDDGWLITAAKGAYNVYINTTIDGITQPQQSISLQGAGADYGTAGYGTDVYGGDEMIDMNFTVGATGRRIQYEVFNSNANQPFFVSKLLQDFKPLGAATSGTSPSSSTAPAGSMGMGGGI